MDQKGKDLPIALAISLLIKVPFLTGRVNFGNQNQMHVSFTLALFEEVWDIQHVDKDV